jgi:hypothetical protein
MFNDIEYSDLYFDEYDEMYNSNCNKLMFYPNVEKINEDDICSICLDVLDYQDIYQIENLCKLSCGHHFHKNCIKTWITKNNVPTCPKCRSKCKPKYEYKTIIIVNNSLLVKTWQERIDKFTK